MQVKIIFDLNDEEWNGLKTESLWATPSNEGYILDNYPFFVKGICFGGVVNAVEIDDGIYTYKDTVKKSGNSLSGYEKQI